MTVNWGYKLNRNNWELYKILNVEIPNEFKGVKNYNEFIIKYSNKDWSFNKRYNWIKFFLLKLEQNLENQYSKKIDPIIYIYYLKFIEKLSFKDIYDRLKDFWNYDNKHKDTFEKMSKNVFNWEIWDSCSLDRTREKIRAKSLISSKRQTIEKEKIVEKIEKIIFRIWKENIKNNYNKNLEWKNSIEKLSFFFKEKWLYNWDDFDNYILSFSNKYWLKKTVSAINNILNSESIDFKINKWRISELKNKKTD